MALQTRPATMVDGDSQQWFARGRIRYDAPPEVRDVIASIGRTEDVKLSPDDRRLAIAGFAANEVYVFSIDLDASVSPPKVRLRDCTTLRSSRLAEPHGLTFLGNDHILVCNRASDVCIFRIPELPRGTRALDVTPAAVISGKGTLFAKVKSPGSADCRRLAENLFRVFVCNNHWNFVSCHDVSVGESVRVRHRGRLVGDQIRIPDGVSVSGDGAWIAISNHVDGQILVYANPADFETTSGPAAVLGGLVCPHGVRFTADGKIMVADAASQYLHVFESRGREWRGEHAPVRSIRMLDDETFYDGRYDTREGGIKGIDVDRSNRVLVTTHRLDVLGFYDRAELLTSRDEVDREAIADLRRQRDDAIGAGRKHMLARRWRMRRRAGHAVYELRRRWWDFKNDARTRARMLELAIGNSFSGDLRLDPEGPVVSLTTHANRLGRVHYTIESIARGSAKPSRIVLWLTDPAMVSRLPRPLRRLKSRGLEVRLAEEYGPHSKYYPYVAQTDRFDRPLVTADDDGIYPEDWLERLMVARRADPDAIHCHRVRRMGLAGRQLTPYNSWPTCNERGRHRLNFITGVSGAIYPPRFLEYLKKHRDAFMRCCSENDDIWLTASALRAGFDVAQVDDNSLLPMTIPGSQAKRLFDSNVVQGANQIQLRRTFTEHDVETLRG